MISKQNWYEKSTEETLSALSSTTGGISEREATIRLREHGPNTIPEAKPLSIAYLFARQFTSPLVYILLLVCVAVVFLGEVTDAAIIAFILLFNAVIGAVQEGRAQNTIAALRRFVQTQARVLRAGSELLLPDAELVTGDVVVLRAGDKIPADGRFISVTGALVNEASLTGESEPVAKIIEPIKSPDSIPLSPADQRNMAFKGTSIVAGVALIVVVSTGLNTQIGQLSQSISKNDTEIPLQKNIRALSHLIVMAVGVVSAVFFGVGVLRGEPLLEMVVTVVSLIVSLIPEGLPVVITLILANGVWRMSQRKALIKKMGAVEALGQTDVIAVDKTGTITKNELVVTRVIISGKTFEVTGSGYDPSGEVIHHKQSISATDFPELAFAGKISAFADADLSYDAAKESWVISGDPTEAALLVLAEKLGFKKEDMHSRHKVVQVLPFDYKHKYRGVVFEDGQTQLLVLIGAPEVVASLSGAGEQEYLANVLSMSQSGLRVLAYGYASVSGPVLEDKIPQLKFGGLYGLQDSMHSEVPGAVAEVQAAGIQVVMITGDYKDTAAAIAKMAGIYSTGDSVLTGAELDLLSADELANKLKNTTVFARITPENKLKIVKSFQESGRVIAMTGDGVNDVPPLVAADLGIAMGKTGTDVTKESADIILLDDNFSTIAAAVEEGRNIYNTIKRALLYLFATISGVVFVISGALILDWPIPITAVQILWLNFVTDGFLTITFAFEPKDGNLLRKKYAKPTKYIVDRSMIARMIPMGLIMAVCTLALFYFYKDFTFVKASTMALTVLAVFQWFNAWNARSSRRSAFYNVLANKWLLAATGIVIAAHLLGMYTTFGQTILGTTPLSWEEWVIVLLLGSTIVIYEELVKFVKRIYDKRK